MIQLSPLFFSFLTLTPSLLLQWIFAGIPILSHSAAANRRTKPISSKNHNQTNPNSQIMAPIFPILLLLLHSAQSEPTADKEALLDFLNKTPHENRLQWNDSASVCNWVGVTCDANHSFVSALRLPGVGLVGPIPANTLGRLNRLRVLSLRSNRMSGDLPADFANLAFLRSLYLQGNEFSGGFPVSLTQLTRLTRLDLSFNDFSSSIPFSVNNLTHLSRLFLQNNGFSGSLPSISSVNLTSFNVSNNRLNGSIPKSLEKFSSASFAGNLALCGGPLPPCNPFFPSPAPSPTTAVKPSEIPVKNKAEKLSIAAIVGIVVGAAFVAFLLLLLLLFCLQTRQAPSPVVRGVPAEAAGTSSSKDEITGGSVEVEKNRLVFIEGGVYRFDLEDLLRASAEVLGKGSVGTSYKAVLEEGTAVVVKRLKDVVMTKKEFELQMEFLGNVNHQNVVPLRAFYFSRDEKLIVSDFFAAGSLSASLHGSRGSGRPILDWDNRMKIALNTARGLAHLHMSGKLVHGNIKSSNILLRPDHDGAAVSDYGLNALFGTSTPPNPIAGYRAREVVETQKVTLKSDVYSFGVLLLELLTGKSPNQASLGEEGIDLLRWVQSVVREEWTAEVFDVELMRYHNIEEEMVQLLQIAMTCVAIVPDQRPTMPEVVRMIEDLNRVETDDGLRASSDDLSKGPEDHTPPQESRTTPLKAGRAL